MSVKVRRTFDAEGRTIIEEFTGQPMPRREDYRYYVKERESASGQQPRSKSAKAAGGSRRAEAGARNSKAARRKPSEKIAKRAAPKRKTRKLR